MANMDNIKEKALAALGRVIDKSTDLYESAEEKAKYLAKTTKLKADIAKDNADVKRLYADLGSLYYCLNKGAPDENLAQLCEEIKALHDRIELKQREIDALTENAQPETVETDEEACEAAPDFEEITDTADTTDTEE